MAKKFGKILIGSAAAAAVAAGFAYFMKKKEKECSWNENMEDFEDGLDEDDFSEDTDSQSEGTVSREYVTLHVDHKTEDTPGEKSPDDDDDEPLDSPDDLDAPDEEETAEEAETISKADSAVHDAVASAVKTAVDHASEPEEAGEENT
ncbi:MAG: hypothetical protein SOZ59_01875 [Candidatus Limivivens sp.]|nr:hypothetical protein [Candidatus Limivivens sp.]